MSTGILTIGLTVFLAHFFVVLFRRTRIPDVLLLMLCGIVAGPVLGYIKPADFGIVGPVISTVALIVILFEGGLNLKIHTVLSAMGQTAVIAGLTWLASAIVATLVMNALTPVGWGLSAMTGAIIGATSPAVVVPIITMFEMADKPRAVIFLESAITDVLCIVVAIGIGQALHSGEVNPGKMVGHVTSSFAMALIIGVIGALAWSLLLGWVRQFPNTIFASVAWIFILYGICEVMDLSGPIAALAAGVTLANVGGRTVRMPGGRPPVVMEGLTDVDHLFFGETVFLLKTFFFIYLGISIRFDSMANMVTALIIVALIFAARFVIIRVFASRTYSARDASLMTAMVPKGLAAAVLATLPAQLGLPGAEWVSGIIYPVVLFSIVGTSVLSVLMESTPVGRFYHSAFAGFASTEAGGAAEAFKGMGEPMLEANGLPSISMDADGIADALDTSRAESADPSDKIQ